MSRVAVWKGRGGRKPGTIRTQQDIEKQRRTIQERKSCITCKHENKKLHVEPCKTECVFTGQPYPSKWEDRMRPV